MSCSVNIQNTGSGWIDIQLLLGDKTASLTGVSYTTDAIGDLLRFALQIATGSYQPSVSFDQEPVEWRLVAENLIDATVDKGPVHISVYQFPNMNIQASSLSEGILVVWGDCDALEFSRAVLTEAKRFLDNNKDELWNDHPFPTAAIRALEAAIAAR